jgi:hypothetical protein
MVFVSIPALGYKKCLVLAVAMGLVLTMFGGGKRK